MRPTRKTNVHCDAVADVGVADNDVDDNDAPAAVAAADTAAAALVTAAASPAIGNAVDDNRSIIANTSADFLYKLGN